MKTGLLDKTQIKSYYYSYKQLTKNIKLCPLKG